MSDSILSDVKELTGLGVLLAAGVFVYRNQWILDSIRGFFNPPPTDNTSAPITILSSNPVTRALKWGFISPVPSPNSPDVAPSGGTGGRVMRKKSTGLDAVAAGVAATSAFNPSLAPVSNALYLVSNAFGSSSPLMNMAVAVDMAVSQTIDNFIKDASIPSLTVDAVINGVSQSLNFFKNFDMILAGSGMVLPITGMLASGSNLLINTTKPFIYTLPTPFISTAAPNSTNASNNVQPANSRTRAETEKYIKDVNTGIISDYVALYDRSVLESQRTRYSPQSCVAAGGMVYEGPLKKGMVRGACICSPDRWANPNAREYPIGLIDVMHNLDRYSVCCRTVITLPLDQQASIPVRFV